MRTVGPGFGSAPATADTGPATGDGLDIAADRAASRRHDR